MNAARVVVTDAHSFVAAAQAAVAEDDVAEDDVAQDAVAQAATARVVYRERVTLVLQRRRRVLLPQQQNIRTVFLTPPLLPMDDYTQRQLWRACQDLCTTTSATTNALREARRNVLATQQSARHDGALARSAQVLWHRETVVVL